MSDKGFEFTDGNAVCRGYQVDLDPVASRKPHGLTNGIVRHQFTQKARNFTLGHGH